MMRFILLLLLLLLLFLSTIGVYGAFSITNPYTPRTSSIKYFIHAHTTNSDGSLSPAEVATKLRGYGINAASITDHMMITTDPANTNLIWILGEEYANTGERNHFNGLFITDVVTGLNGSQQSGINSFVAQGGFVIANHPNYPSYDITLEELLTYTNYQAIEVYNKLAPSESTKNSELKWDGVLASGNRKLGIAGQDAHSNASFGNNVYQVVFCDACDEPDIKSNLFAGNYTMTTGYELHLLVSVTNNTIYANTRGTNVTFEWIGTGTVTNQTTTGVNNDSYIIPNTNGYIRIRARTSATVYALSNPIWFEYSNNRINLMRVGTLRIGQ